MSFGSRDYETIDHILRGCNRLAAKKPHFWIDLRSTDIEWGTPIRDILGKMWHVQFGFYNFADTLLFSLEADTSLVLIKKF
jgi:hypothetical protein